MTEKHSGEEAEPPSAPPMSFLGLGTSRLTVLAWLLCLLLVDAAVETFARRSPVRWWVVAVPALYLGGTAELWRRRHPFLQRLGWPPCATISSFVLFGLIVWTAWLPGGLQNGLGLLGLRTPAILSLISAAAVAWSAVMAVRLNYRHPALKWAMAAAAGYGVIAFFHGAVAGASYSVLFHGGSFWTRLPFRWLEGVYAGTLVLVLALVINGQAVLRAERSWRDLQKAAALAMALAIVVAGIWTSDSTRSRAVAEYPILKQFEPKAQTAAIRAVSLSSRKGGTAFDPAKVGTRFADGAEHVVLWYRWQGAEAGRRVDIQWAKDGEIVLEQWEVLQGPSGSTSWYLEKDGAGPLPAGRYQVTLLENGTRVTEIPFQVAQ